MQLNFQSENETESKIVMLFSEKVNGPMNFRGHPQLDDIPRKNRDAFLSKHEIQSVYVIDAELAHGRSAYIIDPSRLPIGSVARVKKVDTLVTGKKGIFLSVAAADCFPIYFYDPVKEVIALSHAGWRGVTSGIVEQAIQTMREEFNCNPADIEVFLGPGIQQCHFEVGPEVAKLFPYPDTVLERQTQIPITPQPANPEDPSVPTHEVKKKLFVDMQLDIFRRLAESGISMHNISLSTLCTFCNKGIAELKPLPEKSKVEYRFFSWRRDHQKPLQAQMAVIGMKNK